MQVKTQYYSSWTGYNVPLKPQGPIKYEEAELLRAYCIGYLDQDGRLLRFEKWLVRRTTTLLDNQLRERYENLPGVYFFSVPPSGEQSIVGDSITIGDTQTVEMYLKLVVDQTGSIDTFEKVTKQMMLRHEYEYWDNGTVKECRFTQEGKPGGVFKFDRKGNRTR